MDPSSQQGFKPSFLNQLDRLSPFPHCTECIHKIKAHETILDLDENGNPILDETGNKRYRNFKVGILGGGVAGLNAALYFRRLNKHFNFNIDYEIIEGDARIGGRIKTHYYEKTFDWQYSDMGAMRLPRQHSPTFDLISYVNTELAELNKNTTKPYPLIELIPYYYDSRNAKDLSKLDDPAALNCSIYYSRDNAAKFQLKDLLNKDGNGEEEQKRLSDKDLEYLKIAREANDAYSKAMDGITKEFVEAIRDSLLVISPQIKDIKDIDQKLDKLEESLFGPESGEVKQDSSNTKFLQLMIQYGSKTLFQYLDEVLEADYPEKLKRRRVMDNWENIFGYVGNLQISLVEQIFEDKDFSSLFDPEFAGPTTSSSSSDDQRVSIWPRGPIQFVDHPDRSKLPYWHTISGGLQTLTDAMYKLVGNSRVKLNNRVIRVENIPNQKTDETPLGKVCVHFSNGKKEWYDRIIVTLPTSACANIDWLGFDKFQNYMKAFRNLNADPLFKHSVQFSHRFWEDPTMVQPDWAFVGGQSYTDLGSRNLVFPSYGFENGAANSGTVLSYNFYQDGVRMLGLTEEERTQRVLTDLQFLMDQIAIKPFNVRDFYTGNSYSQSWMNSPANGLAYFRPTQYHLLKYLAKGFEDRILFAGEHLSVHHGWIVGSLQSSNRAIMKMIKPPEELGEIKFLVDEDKYRDQALHLEGLIKP